MRMKKDLFLRLSFVTTCLFLLLGLASCGEGSTSSVSVNSTPTSTSTSEMTSTSTPTSETTSTSTPTSEAKRKTYTAIAYTVDYPESWEVKPAQDDAVILSYPAYQANFGVSVSNDDSLSVSQQIDSFLIRYANSSNDFHSDPPKDITIGGQSWKQVTWTGVNKSSGNTFKGSVAVASYQGRNFSIDYSALSDNFDALYTGSFQLMEQSFTFK